MNSPAIIPVKQLLTNSRQKAYRACPRLEEIKYRKLYVPKKKRMPLIFGTAVHLGLETYWKAIQREDFSNATAAALHAISIRKIEDPYAHARLAAMVGVYCEYWMDFAKTVKVLEVETQFRAPLVNPDDVRMVARTWERAGKVDGIIRLKNGQVAVLEHKTAGVDVAPGSNYRGQLAMDSQISMYFHGSIALGHGCDLCLYDILKKPTTKPFLATPADKRKIKKDGTAPVRQREKDETPEEYTDRLVDQLTEEASKYFVHVEVGRTQAELLRDARDTWHTVRAMHESEKAGYFHRNADACHRYGSPCEFIGVCQGIDSLHDTSKYFRMEMANPELQEDSSEAEGDGE